MVCLAPSSLSDYSFVLFSYQFILFFPDSIRVEDSVSLLLTLFHLEHSQTRDNNWLSFVKNLKSVQGRIAEPVYLFAHHSVLVHSRAITHFHLGAAQYSPSLSLWATEQCHWGSWELSAHMGIEITSCLIPTSLTFKLLVPSVK